jgi:hypothetical protein
MTNQNPINPNPRRAAIISRQDFRALVKLAFFDCQGAMADALAAKMNVAPRSAARWLSLDEKFSTAPIEAVALCYDLAAKNQRAQDDLIERIASKLNEI